MCRLMKDKVSKLQGDVEVLRDKVNGHSEILDRVVSVEINIASVTEKVDSAHKRLDKEEQEVEKLRTRTHDHANAIQRHVGILAGMENAVKELVSATKDNTQAVLTFRIIALTAVTMGTGFIGFCGFIGGKIMHWW